MNYDRPILEAASRGREDFNLTFQRIEDAISGPNGNDPMDLLEFRLAIDEVENKFKEALDDDFNTPKAMAALFELSRESRKILSQAAHPTAGAKTLLGEALEKLNRLGGILGIVSSRRQFVPEEVLELARVRLQMKAEKKFKEADEIRNKVLGLGFTIEDVKGGQSRVLPKK